MQKKRVYFYTALSLFILIYCASHPVHSKTTQLGLLFGAAGAWAGSMALFWKNQPLRIALLASPLILALPFFLPKSEIQTAQLRQLYVTQLKSFENTDYHWGGENSHGIDCSGLPRKALRNALLEYSFTTRSSSPLTLFGEQWIYDTSAKALSEGYRQQTFPLGLTGAIREIKYDKLLPGDIAVTTNGLHALVYLGDEQWIQADPNKGKVLTLNGYTDANRWFNTPVTMHRWSVLK